MPPTRPPTTREFCSIVDELWQRVAASRATAEAALSDQEAVAAIGKLKLSLASLGDSVAQLRWLTQVLIPSEHAQPTYELGVLVRECLANTRSAFPPSCTCKTRVQPGLWVHIDETLLVEALSVLLNAAALRLHGATDSQTCPRLSLSLKARKDLIVLGLAYNASRRAPGIDQPDEQRALELLTSLGGAASIRNTKRWSLIQIRLPSRDGGFRQRVALERPGEQT